MENDLKERKRQEECWTGCREMQISLECSMGKMNAFDNIYTAISGVLSLMVMALEHFAKVMSILKRL